MSNDVALSQSFQEKVFAKIREQIGELMSDEDLKKLVEASVTKAFFEPIIVNEGYGRTSSKPPVFVTSMMELVKERVNAALKEWIATHEQEVAKVIDEAIAKGFFGLVSQYMDSKMSWPLQQFAEQLKQKGLV